MTKLQSIVLAIGTAVIAFLAGVGLMVGVMTHTGTTEVQRCATEDQTTACYWDSQTRGTGQGDDFIVTNDGAVIYVELTNQDKVMVSGHTYVLHR